MRELFDRHIKQYVHHPEYELSREEQNEVFQACFDAVPHRKDMPVIHINQKMHDNACDWAKKIIEFKEKEDHHKRDRGNEMKRWCTSYITELSIRISLGYPEMPAKALEFGSHSADYDNPDLRDLLTDTGMKGVHYGLLPLVKVSEPVQQIISVISPEQDEVYIMGLATTRWLHTCSSRSFVSDKRVVSKKRGFWGWDMLIPVPSVTELVRMSPARSE